MNSEQTLVENLIARLEPASHGAGFVWNGILTKREIAALRKLAGLSMESDVSPVDEVEIAAPAIIPALSLNKCSLDEKLDDELIVCLDFGTAFSKAAATDCDGGLIEIALGKEAAEPLGPFPVQSSIYITEDRIWFGPQAVSRSVSDNDPKRRRFDSPKQEMSQGDLAGLRSQLVDININPTREKFTKGDLIQLYLAYLIDLTNSQLAARRANGLPLRRFARPCWADERANAANEAFRNMLAKGQIIGDTMHGSWRSGIPVSTARGVLDQANELNRYPAWTYPSGDRRLGDASGSLI